MPPPPPETPRLWLRTALGPVEVGQPRVVVGREQSCDVVVDDPRASRRHLTFELEGGSWVATDSSSGGTFVDGVRTDRFTVTAETVHVRLGAPDGEGLEVKVLLPAPAAPLTPATPAAPVAAPPPYEPAPPPYQPTPPAYGGGPPPYDHAKVPPGQLTHGQTMLPGMLSHGRAVTIGRDRTNDVVLDDPLVSRFHARLELGSPAVLHDLGSFNGIFVDNLRVKDAAWLQPGSQVILGNQSFVWDGTQLVVRATRHEFTLYADGLSVVVAGGKRLIDNMSFQLDPSSLTAVIGPSGAGKSTLLGALTGLRPATHGRVVWQGHDLYTHYDQLRFQIGLVPQQDIQHPQLKVEQALAYAAELRLPPDTTAVERRHRVHTVAGQLQLLERLDNRIGTQLSGGQKKRVSIATELLTAPPLLFLDEPTSGLDPGLDLEVMRQLRTLADDGRVVMVVTHSVLALDVCDHVMVLAPGGRIAYFGPPAGVLAHFGCATYPEVFDMLDDHDLWHRIPAPGARVETQQLMSVAAGVPAPPRQSWSRQLLTLVRRNLSVVAADRLLLTMLIALPLVLGGLSRLVPGSDGLSLDATVGDAGLFDPEEARQRLVVLIVAASLMGVAMTIRELVGERPIFRREYAVGLSPPIYLVSKILVLGSAAFGQGVLVTWIATVGLDGPDGRLGLTRVALTIGALTFTMAVVGLALSAVVTSTEQTMPALVGTIMVQLVLSGSLFQVAGRPVLEQVAWLAPSRWGYGATASVMGLTRAASPDEDRDWIALPGADHFVMDLAILGLLCLASIGLGLLAVRRSATAGD